MTTKVLRVFLVIGICIFVYACHDNNVGSQVQVQNPPQQIQNPTQTDKTPLAKCLDGQELKADGTCAEPPATGPAEPDPTPAPAEPGPKPKQALEEIPFSAPENVFGERTDTLLRPPAGTGRLHLPAGVGMDIGGTGTGGTGGTAGGSGPTASQSLQVNSINWWVVSTSSCRDRSIRFGTLNAPDLAPDSHPVISIPPNGTLCIIIDAEGNLPLRYKLSSGNFSQTTDRMSESDFLTTEGLVFQGDIPSTLTLTVTDSSSQSWSKEIIVSVETQAPSPVSGSLDTSFDGDGTLVVSGMHRLAKSIIVRNDNSFLVAGVQTFNDSPRRKGVILRFFDNGSLDTSFGDNGKRIIEGFASTRDIATTTDGKIILVGASSNDGCADILISRLNQDGSDDNTFITGTVKSSFSSPTSSPRHLMVVAAKVLANGNILLAGWENECLSGRPSRTNIVLWQFKSNGAADTSFVTPSYPGVVVGIGNYNTIPHALALQGDKIIVAGSLCSGPESNECWPLLLRTLKNGTLDTTFGSNHTGYVVLGTPGVNDSTSFYDITTQSDDKIIATGNGFTNQRGIFLLVLRFDQNGQIDTTFGVPNVTQWITSIALQANGNILLGGRAGGRSKFFLSRLTTAGILDTTFGPEHTGYITTVIGEEAKVETLKILPSGKILAAGIFYSVAGNSDTISVAISRYHP